MLLIWIKNEEWVTKQILTESTSKEKLRIRLWVNPNF
jgi:hypothetical protein